MESLECSICNEVYNPTDHRPKTLDCGHTICLKDLKDLARRKTPFLCPLDDKECTKAPDAYPDNQVIIAMLDNVEVRCREHEILANKFCLKHIRVVCEECKHDCELKTLPQDINEVKHVVVEEIKALAAELQGKIDKGLKAKVDRRFNELLRDNLNVLHTLTELKISLTNIECIQCSKPANMVLRTANFDAYCSDHFTQGSEESGSIPLQDLNRPRICADIKAVLLKLLKKINFYDLTKEDLDLLDHLPDSPKDLQQFGRSLLRRTSTQVGSFQTVPDVFCCPECRNIKNKADTKLSVMPCREALHAICQQCAFAKKGEAHTICPLDKSSFGSPYSTLKVIPEVVQQPVMLPPEVAGTMSSRSLIRDMPAQGYSQYDSQLPQYPGAVPYGGPPQVNPLPLLKPGLPQQFNPLPKPGAPQFQPSGLPYKPGPNPSPQQVHQTNPSQQLPLRSSLPQQFPPQFPGPSGLSLYQPGPPSQYQLPGTGLPTGRPLNPGPSAAPISQPASRLPQTAVPDIPRVVGTDLPPFEIPGNYIVLDRFPSVLPPIGLPASQRTQNMRGWHQTQGKNQVEALTFSCTESVKLVGLSIAAPIEPNQVSIVDSISFFRGTDTRGAAVYVHSSPRTNRIQSGNVLLGTVMFSQRFDVQAYQKYSLKIKLSGEPSPGYETYRGNPFDRPDIWFGLDGSIWEFEECTQVIPTEYLNGQNNLSGPILRFVYER